MARALGVAGLAPVVRGSIFVFHFLSRSSQLASISRTWLSRRKVRRLAAARGGERQLGSYVQ